MDNDTIGSVKRRKKMLEDAYKAAGETPPSQTKSYAQKAKIPEQITGESVVSKETQLQDQGIWDKIYNLYDKLRIPEEIRHLFD